MIAAGTASLDAFTKMQLDALIKNVAAVIDKVNPEDLVMLSKRPWEHS